MQINYGLSCDKAIAHPDSCLRLTLFKHQIHLAFKGDHVVETLAVHQDPLSRGSWQSIFEGTHAVNQRTSNDQGKENWFSSERNDQAQAIEVPEAGTQTPIFQMGLARGGRSLKRDEPISSVFHRLALG